MILFNVRALLSIVPAVVVRLCIERVFGGPGTRGANAGLFIGILIAMAIDAGDRWHNGRGENRHKDLIDPKSGGHIFFVPIWCWALLLTIAFVFGTHQ